MAQLPAMPVWTDAILGDTSHLSPAEFGAYCRILFVMWRHRGYLPRDEHSLRRITGMTAPAWRKSRHRILVFLTEAEDGEGRQKWTQQRLKKEYLRALEKSAKQSARRRGQALDKSQGDSNRGQSAVEPEPPSGHNRGSTIHTHTHNHKEEGGGGDARARDFEDPFGGQAADAELDRLRAACQAGNRGPWRDAQLAPLVERWKADLDLTMDEIVDEAADVAAGAFSPIRTPSYLTEPMTRLARRKAQAAQPITPAEGEAHARPRTRDRDTPAPVDIEAAIVQFRSWGRE